MDNSSVNANKPLGEILIEAGLISIGQIEVALREQKETGMRIGEILVFHGWILQETVDFFGDRWNKLLKQEKKPLIYYFKEASLLSKEQIDSILKLQKLKHKKVRFHHLAVEQGYIKQKTVDFFLTYLFKIHNPRLISVSKAYEVLNNYSQGIKDFSRITLKKAPLMSVTLESVVLDDSDLSNIDLSKANLSYSSLIRVNLDRANLNRAVLTKANLSKSCLTNADLQEANLEKVDFTGAILQGVNFESSHLAEANFARADLTKAKLPLEYPYDVYYDRQTIFDRDFDPKLTGWKLIDD